MGRNDSAFGPHGRSHVDGVEVLSTALHQVGTAEDLERVLAALLDDFRRAVASALGLQLTTQASGERVALVHFWPGVTPAQVRTSLEVPLPRAGPGAAVVFYAAVPGALVDLAADLAFALGLGLDRLRLDRHTPDSTASGIRGLAELSLLERAIGVLIEQGSDPESAERELAGRGVARGTTGVEQARVLLGQLNRRGSGPGGSAP